MDIYTFPVVITEKYYAYVNIEANTLDEAQEILDNHDFDWNDTIESGDIISIDIEEDK